MFIERDGDVMLFGTLGHNIHLNVMCHYLYLMGNLMGHFKYEDFDSNSCMLCYA